MRVDTETDIGYVCGMKSKECNPLGVSLQSKCEASVDPGCSRSQAMMGLARKKKIRHMSLLSDRP